ncbi:helix-turn-helix transcriptional regulator [Actinosynnema sp. NPDC091369]
MPPPRPTFRRRKLARRLRRMREAAGMTIEDAAVALDKHRNSLYRLEAGETRVDVHLARSMMDVYDHYDPNLIDDVRDALKPQWWMKFGMRAMGYVDLETEARETRELALVYIPGLLQTEPYMRAIFEADALRRTRAELKAQVQIRTIRQRRLIEEEDPLHLLALIDEGAFHQAIGGPEVMRDQLEHLVIMAELNTVTVRVLPRSIGAHGGQNGSFTLLDFPDPEDRTILYVEYPTGSIQVEEPTEVRRAKLLFDHLLDRALSPEDSASLIEQIIAEHE